MADENAIPGAVPPRDPSVPPPANTAGTHPFGERRTARTRRSVTQQPTVQQPVVRVPVTPRIVPQPVTTPPSTEFALVRPYVASDGDDGGGSWRAGAGPKVRSEAFDSDTMRLAVVVPASATRRPRGPRRLPTRVRFIVALVATTAVAVISVGSYALWTEGSLVPAGYGAMPAPLPDLPVASPKPHASPSPSPSDAASSTSAHHGGGTGGGGGTVSHHSPSPAATSPSVVPSSPAAVFGTGPSPDTASASPSPTIPLYPQKGVSGVLVGYGSACVDDNGRMTTNGNKIQMYECNGTPAQYWTFGTDGTLRVMGMCMQVPAASPGALVQLWTCDGSAGEIWRAGRRGTLINVASSMCLDDPGFNSSDGTQLDIWPCNRGANQVWEWRQP